MIAEKTKPGRLKVQTYDCFMGLSEQIEGKERARENRVFRTAVRTSYSLASQKELDLWMIRMGMSTHSSLPANKIGIYTDFT